MTIGKYTLMAVKTTMGVVKSIVTGNHDHAVRAILETAQKAWEEVRHRGSGQECGLSEHSLHAVVPPTATVAAPTRLLRLQRQRDLASSHDVP